MVEVEGPAFTRFLFSNTRAGLFWLPIRLFLGFSWLEAGLHKLFDPNNAWLGGGAALTRLLGTAAVRSPRRAGRRSPSSGTATSSTSS